MILIVDGKFPSTSQESAANERQLEVVRWSGEQSQLLLTS